MRYIANVTKLAATPQGSEFMSLFPLEAKNEMEAARLAAEGSAKAIYGFDGAFIGAVQPQEGDNLFLATVGGYRHGVVTGRTLSILIRKYEGR